MGMTTSPLPQPKAESSMATKLIATTLILMLVLAVWTLRQNQQAQQEQNLVRLRCVASGQTSRYCASIGR
jgi:hypothetical protein